MESPSSVDLSNIRIFRHTFLGNCEAMKIETWYTLGQWADVSCILESCCCCLFVNLFRHFSFQFSTLKFLVTLFSGTVRPRRLKLGTHVDSGQMYHVYRNQAAAAYSSLYFFIFLSLQFSTLKFFVTFSRELWGLDDWKLVHAWTVGRCIMYTRIRLLLPIHSFISSFFFLSNFNIETFHQSILRNCEA